MQLRMKTEETEKLKSELRDLKEIIELGKKVEEHNVEDTSNDKEDEDKDVEEILYRMKNNGSRRRSPQFDSLPPRPKPNEILKPKEKEYNCDNCYFQGTEENELKNM